VAGGWRTFSLTGLQPGDDRRNRDTGKEKGMLSGNRLQVTDDIFQMNLLLSDLIKSSFSIF
jgi:hypothetical protein